MKVIRRDKVLFNSLPKHIVETDKIIPAEIILDVTSDNYVFAFTYSHSRTWLQCIVFVIC